MDKKYFFGRKDTIRNIFAQFEKENLPNVAIWGDKRSGKTSILKQIKAIAEYTSEKPKESAQWREHQIENYHLPESAHHIQFVFINFQNTRIKSQSTLLKHILKEIFGTNFLIRIPAEPSLENFEDIISKRLRHKTVIMLDEIGKAIHDYKNEFTNEFWEGLRSFVTERCPLLAFLISSHHHPIELSKIAHGQASSFFNVFGHSEKIGDFTEQEAKQLINQLERTYSNNGEIDFYVTNLLPFILEEGKKKPFWIQILCNKNLDQLKQNGIHDIDWDKWKQELIFELKPYKERMVISLPLHKRAQ